MTFASEGLFMLRADWRFADLGEVGFFIDLPHR
jgi:hypothetical protein